MTLSGRGSEGGRNLHKIIEGRKRDSLCHSARQQLILS
jgi:hypothetical protein